jgi:hypothetical protein
MEHLKHFESFDGLTAKQRNYQRKKAEFDAMPDKEKKKYDAKYVMRILKKAFPDSIFKIVPYYDSKNLKAVFLSYDNQGKNRLINMWRRDEKNDGLDDKLFDFLKKNNLDHSWRHAKEGYSWDGILIKPLDYQFYEMYYNTSKEPSIKIEDKKQNEINDIIAMFKEKGLKLYEPDNGLDVNGQADRYKFHTDIDGMTFEIQIMRSSWFNNKTVEEQVAAKMNKLIQTKKRHWEKVKEIYQFCENFADGPLWTMCGGGAQLQQFFGDDYGYIGVLYLDMENPNEPGVRDQTFVVNQAKKDKHFENFQSQLGTKIRLYKNTYAK